MKSTLTGLNRHLFTETGADSASLNVLGTLVHRFPDEGDYLIEVRRDDELLGSRLLAVSHDYHTLQATYDLATFGEDDADDCDCGADCTCEEDFDCVREDGVAVFHVGAGPGGYSVTVEPVGERRERREFDSDELAEDDAFSVLLLRPGTYTARNELDGAEAEVTVRYPDGETGAAARDAAEVTVSEDGFEPASVEVDPGEGVSFALETEAHVVVELADPHERATDEVGPRGPARRRVRLDVGTATPFDPSEFTVSEVEERLAGVDTGPELRALLLSERRGENRSGVVGTLRERIRDSVRRPR